MRQRQWARTYGMKAYESNYRHLARVNLEKLLLEKYLDIVIMVVLNVNAWNQYPELNFWDGIWNFINSICTIIWILYIVLYPIYGYIGIRMNIDNLESRETKAKFGIFYQEQRYSTLHGALFNCRAMMRRFLMVLVITLFEGLPYFQVAFLTILSFVTLFYLAMANAYKSKEENKSEFFNEFLIYSSIWVSMNFQMKNTLLAINISGWYLVFCGLVLILGSIVITLLGMGTGITKSLQSF